jgi:predicted TIM-barrel fold metal-dependent hydrolase
MRVIDSHVHLYPPAVNGDPAGWAEAHGETEWSTLCTRRRASGVPVQNFPSVDELLAEMDRADVERSILLGWYWATPEACELQNRFYAECVRAHPDRLSAFATLQPRAGRDRTMAELGRASDDGIIGIGELSPHSQGYPISDAVFREVLATAAELDLPVNLHVTDPNSGNYPGRRETPLEDFATLAREFRHTTFILAHWGGLLPLRDPAAATLTNLLYDSAASPLMYDDSVWKRILAVVPAERVLFGSDFPLNNFPKTESAAEMGRFLDEARRAGVGADVLRGNARRLFRF